MNIQYISLIQCIVEFLHWVIQVIVKLFCLKLGPYSFTKFLYYNQKDLWLAPFLQVEVSVVNSAGSSFCWNYATDTCYSNYTGANILQLCRFWGSIAVMLVVLSATIMLVDLFVAIMQVNVYVAIMLLEVSATFMQVKVSATNILVSLCCNHSGEYLLQSFRWYFLKCIMYMTISIVIMQMTVSVVAMYVTVSSSSFIFLSLTDTHFS